MSHVRFDVVRTTRWCRKCSQYILAQPLPEKSDSAHIWRWQPIGESQWCWAFEWITLARLVSSSLHGIEDIFGNAYATDVAERTCQPAGDNRLSMLKELVQQLRRIRDHGERCAGVDGVLSKVCRRTSNQRCG